MSLSVMVSWQLAKQPEQRMSKNSNTYCPASIRVQAAEGDLFASVTAFGDLAGTLVRLAKGDPITIIGTGKLSTYQGKEGDTKAGLSIPASRIIALVDHQSPPRQRQHRTDSPRQTTGSQYRQTDERQYQPAAPCEFADDVPF